jgi:hypothetical protein
MVGSAVDPQALRKRRFRIRVIGRAEHGDEQLTDAHLAARPIHHLQCRSGIVHEHPLAGDMRARRIVSPAVVTPIDKLAAISRFDMPPARSLSTSRILRMGNLSLGTPPPCKGGEAMPIRRSPNSAGHTPLEVASKELSDSLSEFRDLF